MKQRQRTEKKEKKEISKSSSLKDVKPKQEDPNRVAQDNVLEGRNH